MGPCSSVRRFRRAWRGTAGGWAAPARGRRGRRGQDLARAGVDRGFGEMRVPLGAREHLGTPAPLGGAHGRRRAGIANAHWMLGSGLAEMCELERGDRSQRDGRPGARPSAGASAAARTRRRGRWRSPATPATWRTRSTPSSGWARRRPLPSPGGACARSVRGCPAARARRRARMPPSSSSSRRTVDHHVSGLLRKLDARTSRGGGGRGLRARAPRSASTRAPPASRSSRSPTPSSCDPIPRRSPPDGRGPALRGLSELEGALHARGDVRAGAPVGAQRRLAAAGAQARVLAEPLGLGDEDLDEDPGPVAAA